MYDVIKNNNDTFNSYKNKILEYVNEEHEKNTSNIIIEYIKKFLNR